MFVYGHRKVSDISRLLNGDMRLIGAQIIEYCYSNFPSVNGLIGT